MKHQILKSVAVVAFLSLVGMGVQAYGQVEGIEGYRGEMELLDGKKWVDKGVNEIERQADKVTEQLDLTANKILDMGGATKKFQKMANNGAKSFKVLENLTGFEGAGTTGDRWLNEFYGVSSASKDLDKYLKGDLMSQLRQANGSAAVDKYNDAAKETYIRAAIAQAIYDDTGWDNGDLWMVGYVPSVAVGQVLVNKDESSASMSSILSAGDNMKDAALAMQDLSKMGKDFDIGDANEMSDIGEKLMDNAKEEASRMLSLDAMRFMNEDALGDMNDKMDSVNWIGAGIPTMDILNLIVGMYNVDSVYATTDQNARGRTDIMAKTEGIQVGEFKSCVTSGQKAIECCQAVVNGGMLGNGTGAVADGAVSYKECCKAMTGNEQCIPIPIQTAIDDCEVRQKEMGVTDWTMCDFKCKNTDFGDLVHREMKNGETEWDKEKVANLLEECGVGEEDWAPSPTVLTSAELAAVVPETIKQTLE